MSLIIRTDNGDFDLFGNEDIVQTLGIYNFENISNFVGEYSNVFNLPLTNNNSRIIKYADYIISTDTTPYQKIEATLIIDGLENKKGLLIVEEVSDVIKARFISGNSNLFSLLKEKYLTDLDWSEYNHIWNLSNAVASAANTSGYVYPVIDYNGQTLAGDIVDVRKVLPATFEKTTLDKIFTDVGYTAVYDFDTTDLETVLLPYSKKNPTVSAEVLLLNSVDVKTTTQQSFNTLYKQLYAGFFYFLNAYQDLPNYTDIVTAGSSTNYNFTSKKYVAQYSGNYTINALCELVNYDFITYTFSDQKVIQYTLDCNTYLRILKKSGGVYTVIKSELCAYNSASYNNSTPPYKDSITGISTTYLTNTTSVEAYLNSGDEIYVQIYSLPIVNWTVAGIQPVNLYGNFTPQYKANATLQIDLDDELVFGGLITYSSMLPKIRCNDYFKDVCIRFGLIPSINEYTKTVTLKRFDDVLNNINNRIIWTNKLDETNKPIVQFKYDSYAQNNYFKYKDDKSIIKTDENANYNLTINNYNLELEKTLYTSPFASSENSTFNTTLTCYINLYDTDSGKFDNDVQPRICFSEPLNGIFKFTDGTTTSAYINTRRLWFIDNAYINKSMGFGFLIPQYSRIIITTLQELKLIKADFNLSILDINTLDYFIPVYVEQFQCYCFISSIKQFNYTNPELTEVELIKLNP